MAPGSPHVAMHVTKWKWERRREWRAIEGGGATPMDDRAAGRDRSLNARGMTPHGSG